MIIIRKRLKKYYIVSENSDLEKHIISPAVPNNFLTKGKFWDTKTPRIRLYDTVRDAISATFLGQILQKETKLYVYEATGLDNESLIGPVSIDKIPYFQNIKEWWYLRSCRVKFIGTIQINGLGKEETYMYGPRQTKAKIYRWKWSEVLKPWEEKFGPKLPNEKHYSDPLSNLNDKQLEKLADKVTDHRRKNRLKKKRIQDAKKNTLASNGESNVIPTAQDEATQRASRMLNYKKAIGSEQNFLKREYINTIRNDNSA